MSHPPRMEDLQALTEAALTVPPETEARLIALQFELTDCAQADPEALAQFAFVVEQGRTVAQRQLDAALKLLAERQTCIEIHQSRDQAQRAEIRRLQERVRLFEAGRPWWLRWWI